MAWYWIVLMVWMGISVGFMMGGWHANNHRPSMVWQQSFLTGMMSIFHEGEVARYREGNILSNPYRVGSPEFRSWDFGWYWMDSRTRPGFIEPILPGD